MNDYSQDKTRMCVVNGEVGYFHMWEEYSKPLPESPTIGGPPAGIFSKVFGIVEFLNGVRRVDPTDIEFRDDITNMLFYIDQHEDAKNRILKGPIVKTEGEIEMFGKQIDIEGGINGRYYMEMPDGYRLIFDNDGYQGRYNPNIAPEDIEKED